MNEKVNQPIVIQANEEGRKAIESVCDLALKLGGLQVNLAFVHSLLKSIKPIPPQRMEKPEEVEAKFEQPNPNNEETK